ncbi:MAG: hypothetical protein M0Z55_07490 [Peptococcaceae bacterium]|nr:hypothetical protein [Peptococcaceae bacterium]
MKVLEERINEYVEEFGPILPGKFPSWRQLKLMLQADGYAPAQIEAWFAQQFWVNNAWRADIPPARVIKPD